MKKFSLVLLLLSSLLFAKNSAVIDAEVSVALKGFEAKHSSGFELIVNNSKAYLIFPSVVKAGFGIGGEYGEGVLMTPDHVKLGYYSTASASIGFQLGVQKKSIIIAFLTDASLQNFMKSDGWKVGVDGSVTLISIGVSGEIDSSSLNKPIVGFIFGEKGLMYNLTLEGNKISKINR